MLITCAWVVRRPDFLPTLLIAAVFLLGDVIFMRPLGLWAAFVVMGTEFLRMRAVAWRDLNFLLEWFMVAGVLSAMTLVNRLVLWVIFVDQPALGLTLIRLLGTIAVYPLVVLLAARFFGLRKLAPGAVDRLGHKH